MSSWGWGRCRWGCGPTAGGRGGCGRGAGAGAVARAPGPVALAGALTGLGAALSLYHPAGIALIAQARRARGRAMGVNGMAGNLGTAFGPLLGAGMAFLGEWRLAYVLIAGAGLAAGLGMLWLRLEEPPVEREAGHPQANGAAPADGADPRGLGVLFVAMMFGGLNYRCLMTALPAHLGEGEAAAAGWLAFGVLLLGGVGQFVAGHAVDRVWPARFYVG